MHWHFLFGLLLVAACSKSSPRDPKVSLPDPPDDPPGSVTEQLRDAFEAEDYWVEDGDWFFFQQRDCPYVIDQAGTCYGNNPGTVYGLAMVPPAPREWRYPSVDLSVGYQTRNNISHGLHTVWRMGHHDAVVMIGRTPPESRYHSYIPYLYSTWPARRGDASRVDQATPFAQIDASLNHDTLATEGGPYDAQTVVIMTTDPDLEAAIRRELKRILPDAGLATNIVNTLRVPEDLSVLGFGEYADEFVMLNRVTYPRDAEVAQAYFDEAPFEVLRIVSDEQPGKTFTSQALPERATGTDEAHLSDAYDALVEGVRATFDGANRTGVVVRNLNGPWDVVDCYRASLLRAGAGCGADNHDTVYENLWTLGPRPISDDPDDFMVMVRVNHVATGKAQYASMTVKNTQWQFGALSVTDEDFPDSADPYLAAVPSTHAGHADLLANAELFQVVVFARSCAGFTQACVEIPENTAFDFDSGALQVVDGGRFGVDLDQRVSFAGRIYRDPDGVIGPAHDEVLQTRLVSYQP